MLAKRGFLVLVLSFSLVLVGGVAMAAVGLFGGNDAADAPVTALADPNEAGTLEDNPAVETPGSPDGDETPTSSADEKPQADEPKTEPPETEEPDSKGTSEEPADEPTTGEPAEAPGDEPPDEPGDTVAPELVVTSPADGAHVDAEVITFKGEVEPDSTVFWSKYEANVTDGGAWSIALKLAPGKNVMVFVAKDAAGNASEAAVTVYYEKPETGESAFSAHQKWEVVDGSPAVNVYWGTAEPGAKVWVASDYGTHYVYAGEAGGWELEAAFDAKCNKWFAVAVESGQHRKVFEMKRVCAEESHTFSAGQKWEIVDGLPTENKYWGTAEPGSTVWVGSDFGSGSVKADAEGIWLLWVAFEAPCEEWFGVAVESGEHRKVFEMKRACAEEQETVAFTAYQQYGVCSEEVPYDAFWGTGEPYSAVRVESPYGGGETVVNGEGHWEILVEFPNAPRGDAFQVAVEGSTGSATFTFKAKTPEGA